MNRVTPRRRGKVLLALGILASMTLPGVPVRGQSVPPSGAAPPAVLPPGSPVAAPPVEPPRLLRLTRNVPGDSSPIQAAADEVATWGEQGRRYLLLRGNVMIQHGVVRVRAQNATAILDVDGQQRRGILHVDVYAEGDVKLESEQGIRQAAQGLVELNTRGEVQVRSHQRKVLKQPVPENPTFVRALQTLGMFSPEEEASPQEVQPATLRQTEGQPAPPPAPPVPGATLGQPGPQAPAPPSGVLMPPAPVRPTTPAPQVPGTQASVDKPASAEVAQLTPSAPQAPAGSPPPPPPSAGPRPTTPIVPPPAGATGSLPAPTPAPPGPPGPPLRQYSVAPRTGGSLQARSETLPTGEQATVFTGGVILSVRGVDGVGFLDIEADQALVWSRGGLTQEMVENLRSPGGQSSKELEFYLAGNVEIRQINRDETRVLRAKEIYYDVNRNVAIALNADVEFRPKSLPDPVHFRAEELRQLNVDLFEVTHAEIFSSKLPSDPGFRVYVAEAIVEEKKIPKRSIFGQQINDRKTGQPLTYVQRLVTARNAVLKLENVPIFYTPYLQGDATDPLGPFEGFTIGANRIFGFQIGTTLNMFDLLAIDPDPGSRWRLELDYLSRRGPALGTSYDTAAPEWLTLPAQSTTMVRAWGIYDEGSDILGGPRPEAETHPDWRGRFLWRQNVQDLPEGFTVQSQIAALSDRNVLEQYYKIEFDQDVNQNTYLYAKQQSGNLAWTGFANARIRSWVTETEWLPRLDAYAIGLNPFDFLTYHAWGNVGYGQLKLTNDELPLVSPTDVDASTVRADLIQEISAPFAVGPFKVVPYALLDLTYYSSDIDGSSNGRGIGGGGVRSSLPLSRLYPDAQSDLFNVSGLNHKIVLASNYLYSESTDAYTTFPQFDRLNDDATDQALRDLRPSQLASLNPNDVALATSPLFDPQRYAIRRAAWSRVDTRDDLHVVQLEMRQRLQTKRGLPGNQHIIDWMKLDLSVSLFPQADRDNFGESWSFLEYDYLWNIGDRTAITSSGWIDPFDPGARVFTLGAFLNRPDRTMFYLGYRQIEPVDSQAVTSSVSYVFSPKYAVTGTVSYDFGFGQSLANSLILTRTGTDLQVSLGFTYFPLQNNFGMTFEVLPNLAGLTRRQGGMGLMGLSGR